MNLNLALEFFVGSGTVEQGMNTPFDDPSNPHKFSASGILDEEMDAGREAVPTFELTLQLFPALASKRIDLRNPPEIRLFPARADPALIFEPVQCRIQRALAY
jgi:hypothetical protein